MLNLFKKKKKEQGIQPSIVDINNNPLKVGDTVLSYRYDLGKCLLISEDNTYYYQSMENGKKVSWLKMVDAVTAFQKVEKVQG